MPLSTFTTISVNLIYGTIVFWYAPVAACQIFSLSSVIHLLFRPRGFPLEDIARPSPQFFAREKVRPLIQQFLANVDPDVDAIYRLTQPLGITFDAAAFNVLLPRGSFCPFNRYDVDFGLSATFATT